VSKRDGSVRDRRARKIQGREGASVAKEKRLTQGYHGVSSKNALRGRGQLLTSKQIPIDVLEPVGEEKKNS